MYLDAASFELLAIVVLILANAFFSAAEISIVAVRKSRLAQLIGEGRAVASVVVALKEDPSRFLATVQIGMTVVGSMASVIGGAGDGPLSRAPRPHRAAGGTGAVGRVHRSLDHGDPDLVFHSGHRRVGARSRWRCAHSERLACLTGHPINRLSLLASPLVKLLTVSTDTVLWLFGQHAKAQEAFISEEEVKHMVREGARHGIFDEAERQLIHSVFEFTDTSVREVMVPRSEVHAVEAGSTAVRHSQGARRHRLLAHARVSGRPRSRHRHRAHQGPPARGREAAAAPLPAVMHPAFFVPDSMQISDLLRELQSRRTHMAIVVNEFGTVIGLVTIEDLLEEIVGEIRDEFDVDEEQADPGAARRLTARPGLAARSPTSRSATASRSKKHPTTAPSPASSWRASSASRRAARRSPKRATR